MKRKNKLVAGLICGNEEPRIERCVRSLKQICDEIVIVRAIGSLEPDRTLGIAKKLGCHVGEYFNSPLVADWLHLDDFGRARNQAFAQAYELAGCDGWAMWADCDDVLMPEMAEPHLKALQDCPVDFQWILTDYVIAEQNKRAPRERFFRYKTGWWYRPIHENVQPTNDVKLYMRRDLEIVHQPPIGVRQSNDRNKRILMHNDKMSSHYKFYLHYENFITANHAESAKYGSEALAMTDLDGVHKYETLMNCSMLTTEETALRLVRQARALEPNRREAYGLEASTLLDNKKPEEALLLVEEMLKIPVPNFKQWTHREEWYTWKAQHLKAWCLRELGREDEAKGFEMSVLNSSALPKISLIHATRGRSLPATQAMAMWFARAKHPERIEHIFVFDEDDEQAKTLQRFRHTIQKDNGYSVGAWNLGAKECIGDIIIQLSDDWECPPGWDEMIESRLDITKEQVLRISDGYRKDDLLCMAILTRPYFEKHGLFNPAFKNVYSDTDFTFRAAKNKAIVDATDIAIIHHHPFWEKRPLDATYERGNDVEEYKRAKAIFEAEHSPAKISEIIPKETSNQFVARNEKWLWFTGFSQTHQEIYEKHFFPSFNQYLAQHCELHARKLSYHVGSFGEKEFNEAGRVMLQETINILRENLGRKIILSGCDFHFYRDFISEIDAALHTSELVGINDIHGPICGDFSAFIATERILNLYEWILENDIKFSNEQWTFNAGIQILGIKAKVLSDSFWTYGIQEGKPWRDGDEVRPPKNISLHHANFTIGAENKMKLLNAVLKITSPTQIKRDSQQFDLTTNCGAT